MLWRFETGKFFASTPVYELDPSDGQWNRWFRHACEAMDHPTFYVRSGLKFNQFCF